MNNLELEYFNWICSQVLDNKSDLKYTKLMSHLYDFRFIPTMDMDINRAEDGKSLRRRFQLKFDYPTELISDTFKDKSSCSILEMMIALSIRCEESIMTNEEYGDRTSLWFWNMIESLGLGTMNDERYDERYVNIILDTFTKRQYSRNGEGGLFTIDGIKKDMRKVEIWYQMCWYLDYL